MFLWKCWFSDNWLVKFCRRKRWCSKDLRVRAPAAPVLTHSLFTDRNSKVVYMYCCLNISEINYVCQNMYLRDHSSITSSCFWLFWTYTVIKIQIILLPTCLMLIKYHILEKISIFNAFHHNYFNKTFLKKFLPTRLLGPTRLLNLKTIWIPRLFGTLKYGAIVINKQFITLSTTRFINLTTALQFYVITLFVQLTFVSEIHNPKTIQVFLKTLP